MRRLIWVGCLVPFIGSIVLMVWYWPGALPQDSSSGVWTALAQDFAQGVLYRPTFDEFGFGGTRYMPLFFVLHGVLIRLALDPVTAGLLLTLASLVLFDVATFLTLEELGVERSLALPLAVLGHATATVQLLALQVKGDFLAGALTMGGVYLGLRSLRRPPAAFAAGWIGSLVAFLGAFLTKLTSLAGAVALGLWLWRDRRRAALGFAAALGALIAISLAFIYSASDGRWLASFRAAASGGMRPGYALGAPLWLVLDAVQDPMIILVVLVALGYAALRWRSGQWTFPVVYFAVAGIETLVIFTSPGADTNHFLDLLGAAVLVIGTEMSAAPRRARPVVWLTLVLAGLTLVSWIPGMVSIPTLIDRGGKPTRATAAALAQRLGPAAQENLLSENPILPVLWGGRPRVLDPFTVRLVARQRPEVAAEFYRLLAQREFGAVVLVDFTGADAVHLPAALRACRASDGARCYGDVLFPAGFLDSLERDYRLSFVERPFVVYQPRAAP